MGRVPGSGCRGSGERKASGPGPQVPPAAPLGGERRSPGPPAAPGALRSGGGDGAQRTRGSPRAGQTAPRLRAGPARPGPPVLPRPALRAQKPAPPRRTPGRPGPPDLGAPALHRVPSQPGPALGHLPARSGGPRPGPRRPQRALAGVTPPGSRPHTPAALSAAGEGAPGGRRRGRSSPTPARAAPAHLGAHVGHEGGFRRPGAAATADSPFAQHPPALEAATRGKRRLLGLPQRRRHQRRRRRLRPSPGPRGPRRRPHPAPPLAPPAPPRPAGPPTPPPAGAGPRSVATPPPLAAGGSNRRRFALWDWLCFTPAERPAPCCSDWPETLSAHPRPPALLECTWSDVSSDQSRERSLWAPRRLGSRNVAVVQWSRAH